MERLLREALAARERAPQSECLDAETLAAWSEGALSGSERSFAEAHAARCARCQAVLATMARTAPETRVASAFAIRKWVTLLTPAAAAAAAVALWFAVEPRTTSQPGLRPAPPAVAEPSIPAPVAPSQGEARKEAETKTEADRSAAGREALAKRRDQSSARAQADVRTQSPPTDAGARNPAAAPAAAPVLDALKAAEERVKANPELRSADARAPEPQPAPPAAPAAPAQSATAPSLRRTGTDQQVAQSAADQKQQQNELQFAQARARQELGRGGGQLGFLGETVAIRPPSGDVRWRVLAGRIVEHSLDAGASWTTQYTAPDKTFLLSGVALSPTVAWLVGRGGLVLLTVDGRTWQKIRFPETVDLLGVAATDARIATVMTADKRMFGTTDGGLTWIERKN